jgi:hypothetical protein
MANPGNSELANGVGCGWAGETSLPDTEALKQAVHATLARRGTHAEPMDLDPPPQEWRAAFAHLTAEIGLRATTLDAAYAEVAEFWKALMA